MFSKLEIDDPLHISQIHGFCGLWGLIAVGIFDKDTGIINVGNFKQLSMQLIGILALLAWNLTLSGTFFLALKKLKRFRIGTVYELQGMDSVYCGRIGK